MFNFTRGPNDTFYMHSEPGAESILAAQGVNNTATSALFLDLLSRVNALREKLQKAGQHEYVNKENGCIGYYYELPSSARGLLPTENELGPRIDFTVADHNEFCEITLRAGVELIPLPVMRNYQPRTQGIQVLDVVFNANGQIGTRALTLPVNGGPYSRDGVRITHDFAVGKGTLYTGENRESTTIRRNPRDVNQSCYLETEEVAENSIWLIKVVTEFLEETDF